MTDKLPRFRRLIGSEIVSHPGNLAPRDVMFDHWRVFVNSSASPVGPLSQPRQALDLGHHLVDPVACLE